MAIRVIVNGAQGKMGKLAAQSISNDSELTLVGETGRNDNLIDQIKNTHADVVVDLTDARAVFENVEKIIMAGSRPVIGTSGLLKTQVQHLQEKCLHLKRGGIIAPNFALGAVLMIKTAQEIAKYFSNVEILEFHHDRKKDSPSGTAIRTAELLSDILDATTQKNLSATKETIPGARGALCENIAIHAIRLPGLLAHQQIIFGSLGETLTIRHDTIDRTCYMPGILLACKKVMALKHLVVGLENIL